MYYQTLEVSFYSTRDEEIMSRFVVVNTKWSCELLAKTVYETRNALFDPKDTNLWVKKRGPPTAVEIDMRDIAQEPSIEYRMLA